MLNGFNAVATTLNTLNLTEHTTACICLDTTHLLEVEGNTVAAATPVWFH